MLILQKSSEMVDFIGFLKEKEGDGSPNVGEGEADILYTME